MQSDNQRISELCSVTIQRTCFAASALVYTASREVNSKSLLFLVPIDRCKVCLQLLLHHTLITVGCFQAEKLTSLLLKLSLFPQILVKHTYQEKHRFCWYH